MVSNLAFQIQQSYSFSVETRGVRFVHRQHKEVAEHGASHAPQNRAHFWFLILTEVQTFQMASIQFFGAERGRFSFLAPLFILTILFLHKASLCSTVGHLLLPTQVHCCLCIPGQRAWRFNVTTALVPTWTQRLLEGIPNFHGWSLTSARTWTVK